MKYTIAIALCAFALSATAQEPPIPAYEGCTLAWDYPETQTHSGFRFTIDGETGSTTIGKAARQIKCNQTNLKGKPFGPYTISLVAVSDPPGKDSSPAKLNIMYLARPQLQPPTRVRITSEWEVSAQ